MVWRLCFDAFIASRPVSKYLNRTVVASTRLCNTSLHARRVAAVSPRILRECASLATLLLQDNPLTADQLRDSEGFGEYNARRLAKCDKQVSAPVGCTGRESRVVRSSDSTALYNSGSKALNR